MATSTTRADVAVPSRRFLTPPGPRRRRASFAFLLLTVAAAGLVVGVLTSEPGTGHATPAASAPRTPGSADAAPPTDTADAGEVRGSVDRVHRPPTTDLDPGAGSLSVRFRLPSRILDGNVQEFELEVVTGSGRPLPEDEALEVRVDTELDPRMRGRVWIQPDALLVRPPELRTRLLAVLSSANVPCDVAPGTVRVRVRSLAVDGGLGATEQDLPVRPCDLPSAPEPAPPVDDLEFSTLPD